MIDHLSIWLKSTKLAAFVTFYPWVWPASETLHFIGLCLLFGVVVLVDFRMLGMMKGIPFAALHRLIRWAILGFVINLVSGVLFLVTTPEQYLHNGTFYLKMLFILLAGVNVLVFYVTVFKRMEHLEAGEDAPFSAKVIAAVSIFLWVGVMFLGRMLPYIGIQV